MAETKLGKNHLINSWFRDELTTEQQTEFLEWIREVKTHPEYMDEFIKAWLKHYSHSEGSSKYDHRKGFARFREKISIQENRNIH